MARRCTSKDVKYTFDMVREAPDAPAKLRINPRKDWYANVEAIEAPDAHTVVFRLKKPQPSILMMLASGYSPVYPAHVPVAEFRNKCIGTGPFKLKEWRKGEFVEYVKNPDYFVKGRPYLDGLKYVVIAERGTKFAALQAGRLDAAFPGDSTKTIAEQVVKAEPRIALAVNGQNVNDNLLLNVTKPPFNNMKLRQALSYAVDRRAYVQGRAPGGRRGRGLHAAQAVRGVGPPGQGPVRRCPATARRPTTRPRPRSSWPRPATAPSNPLRIEMAARAIPQYLDFASFVISELKAVGIEATLKQIETAQWHPAGHAQGVPGGAQPDRASASTIPTPTSSRTSPAPRPATTPATATSSWRKSWPSSRRSWTRRSGWQLVAQIQRTLEDEAARPTVGWRMEYYTHWNYVKNLIPHQSIYNWGRMQEVWLDK